VHVACNEWIEGQWHKATYSTDSESYGGRFIPLTYTMGDPHGCVFKGIFEHDK
jgi:hypothetical protein